MPRKNTRPKPTRVPGIWQDGPGRFLVRARWTDPRTGRRRKREGMAATFAEAVSLKERLAGGDDRARRPSRKRFADYAEQWLSAHGGRLAPSTRSRYVVALAHASVQFGQFYVDSIRPADVRSWILKKARGCASSTVNGWLRVLRQALDDAVGDGVLAVNPARAVRSIPERRTGGRRGTALSIEEFRRFLQTVESLSGNGVSEDVARLLLVIAWTGLRKGEALALRWSDLVDGELRVTRSVWRRREKATKTDDPRRIAVVEPLAEVLDEQRRWLVGSQHPGLASGLMFPASPGHAKAGARRRAVEELSWYRSSSVLDEPLERVVEAADIPPISPQSLRRTSENLLRMAGVDQLVRRALAGWRSEKAQAIYASVDRRERDAAAAAVVGLVMGEGE